MIRWKAKWECRQCCCWRNACKIQYCLLNDADALTGFNTMLRLNTNNMWIQRWRYCLKYDWSKMNWWWNWKFPTSDWFKYWCESTTIIEIPFTNMKIRWLFVEEIDKWNLNKLKSTLSYFMILILNIENVLFCPTDYNGVDEDFSKIVYQNRWIRKLMTFESIESLLLIIVDTDSLNQCLIASKMIGVDTWFLWKITPTSKSRRIFMLRIKCNFCTIWVVTKVMIIIYNWKIDVEYLYQLFGWYLFYHESKLKVWSWYLRFIL